MPARQDIAVACVGGCAGLVMALGVSGVLAGPLYGIGAREVATFAGVPAARRAATVDAWQSLRSQ